MPTHFLLYFFCAVLCCAVFAVKYAELVPPSALTAANGSSRGGWEACRFYLLLASQLAIQREQLHQLILYHEANLAGRMDATSARRAEKGV
jgi:hypothetical protein